MNFFQIYGSNTLAGSGNQSYFVSDGQLCTSRTFYKIFCGGRHNYAFLFSNIIDSTFSDGSHSHKNLVLESWQIHGIRVGITGECGAQSFQEPRTMQTVTIDGCEAKTVASGELFHTDGIELAPMTGEYLCLEITFSGRQIPYHEESILPSFVKANERWVCSKYHPFASMVACNRPVAARIGFWGDSITQGIGTEINSYDHWCSVAAERIGQDFAYWNLGLGFGRADDGTSGGVWFYKAKKNDLVAVCFGVNDILQGFDGACIKRNLNSIVDRLTNAGVKVVLQTIPPFDYTGEMIRIWNEVNDYILHTLGQKVEFVFDNRPILQASEEAPEKARFGGHPNADGCKRWGEAFGRALGAYLKDAYNGNSEGMCQKRKDEGERYE